MKPITPPQPALTAGTDQPETPCTRDVALRLAVKRVNGGDYEPSPFDLAIDYQDARGDRYRRAVSEAREMCAQCPIWQQCLRDNRDADGVIAGLTLTERVGKKPPTKRKGCGKPHGASNHSRAGEAACDACKAAQAKRQKERREIAKCGTDSGYYRHRRKLKEPACEACSEAHRITSQLREARRRKTKLLSPNPSPRELRHQAPQGPTLGPVTEEQARANRETLAAALVEIEEAGAA